jgi:G3E family GTPase
MFTFMPPPMETSIHMTMITNTTIIRCCSTPGIMQEKRPFHFKSLQKVVNNLPLSIYRAKGFIYLNEAPDRKCTLQVVGKRARLVVGEPWGDLHPTPAWCSLAWPMVCQQPSWRPSSTAACWKTRWRPPRCKRPSTGMRGSALNG